jgi:hypothetical protein
VSETERHGNIDPNDPLNYAPPRIRERAQDLRSELVPQETPAPEPEALHSPVEARKPRPHQQLDQLADAVSRALQESLEPQPVEPPPQFSKRPKTAGFGLAMGVGAAATVAAVAALVVVFVSPSPRNEPAAGAAQTASLWQSLQSWMTPPRKLAPKLLVHDTSGIAGEPLQLGVSVSAPSAGAIVTINGVAAGARITAGRRTSPNEWQVPAREIGNASVVPPGDFSGAMDLSIELSGDDGGADVSSYVRLSWLREPSAAVPAKPQPAPPSPVAVPAPARAEPARDLDPKEVAGFVRRAQDMLASGDLQPARLLLLRAAEAHDPRAAFILARTYDPNVLKQLGATGPQPDLVLARNWYQKAKEWGASDAQNPLDALASYGR